MAASTLKISVFVFSMLALAASTASSQAPPSGVYLRATDEVEAPGVDQFIADNARPLELGAQTREAIATMTLDDVIAGVCGTVRRGYIEAFERRPENAGLRQSQVVGGERSRKIVVPACLYVSAASANDLRTAAGGEAPSVKARRGEQPDRGVDPGVVVGAVLNPLRTTREVFRTVSYWRGRRTLTVTTYFEPKEGMTVEDFVAGVEAAGRGVVRATAPEPGEIILGLGEAAEGPACEAAPPSFTPEAVRAFYRLARERGRRPEREGGPVRTGDVEVVIVDNGFYGAKRDAPWSEAWVGSPFPSNLFRPSREGVLASSLTASRGEPLNDGDPDLTSGHGTHVTGLVIGGPELKSVSDDIFLTGGDRPWLTITIYNVGNGSRFIKPDTQRDLARALRLGSNHRRIVNMSIAFVGMEQLAPTYDFMAADSRARDLFIVAAGNTTSGDQGRDVRTREIYPAAFGGLTRPNIMTVAAHRADLQLAPFSNYSSTSVDIAAPGCALRSWIGRDSVVPLSGTSMATPLVTFTAALIGSLFDQMQPSEIKQRIVVSGDLLEPPAADNIAFRVRLNTLRSVLMFDDIVELADAPGVFVGGDLERVSGVRCASDVFGLGREDMWSFKRGGSGAYVYRGRSDGALRQPCLAVVDAGAAISFRERFRITQDGALVTATREPQPIPMSKIASIVQRVRIQ